MLKKYNSLSIIGMDKNVGKTTTLNYILNEARGKITLGLTSIGRDGEEIDLVTSTEKPRIYVKKGSLIATAKNCFLNSDITKEILDNTSINTPMGEVIIFKALSDGYVELAGPSSNNYLKEICEKLKQLGLDLVIVDGALSRKTLASPGITDATILCTGAGLSRDINKVVDKTLHTVNLLSLDNEKNKEVLSLLKSILKVGVIYKDNTIKNLNIPTALDSSKEILENLNENSKYIVIKGVVVDKLLEDIMKGTDIYSEITFLVEDGTKLFLSKEVLYRFIKSGGNIKVINPIKIIGISINPKSPYGYEFDKNNFLDILRKNINLPVFDVIGGG
jgi:molybdopterin-guanine dinucleotide biosynthesis protein